MIFTFDQFFESKIQEIPLFDTEDDNDDLLDDSVNNKYIYSLNDITSTKTTLKNLCKVFKDWTNEELISTNNFHYVCELDCEDEKLIPQNKPNYYNKDNNKVGVVYLLTCVCNDDEYILKIGQSRKTWKERLNLYNTGLEKYRNGGSGTNSTTNYKVLQTIRNILQHNPDIIFKVYLYCGNEQQTQDFVWKGISSGVKIAQNWTVGVEYILIQLCSKIQNIPILNTQTKINNKTTNISKKTESTELF